VKYASLDAEVPCPIARTLEIAGERWTLLIIRDALLGACRFDEFRATGIADNILTARLKKLVDSGILRKKPYQKHPVRFEYVLTAKGRALAPVIVALRAWGRQFTKGPDPSDVTHSLCGHDVTVGFYCEECVRTIAGDELRAIPA
jgi:DNA-binding HxlR family transcriptional regulator